MKRFKDVEHLVRLAALFVGGGAGLRRRARRVGAGQLRDARTLPRRRHRRHAGAAARARRAGGLRRVPHRRRRSAREGAAQERSPASRATGRWRRTPPAPVDDKPKLPGGDAALHPLPRRQHRQVEALSDRRHQGTRRRRELRDLPQAARPAHLLRTEPCMDEHPPRLPGPRRQDVRDDEHRRRRVRARARRHAREGRHLQHRRSLVGDAHRHREVHRQRPLRARLQARERRRRRAVLLPHLGRALPRRSARHGSPDGRLAQRRHRRVPRDLSRRQDDGQDLLRAEDVQPLRGLAVHAGLPGRRDLPHQRRRRADRQGLLPRLPLLRAGVPLRLPLHRSADEHGRQVHALLPPASRRGCSRRAARPARPARGSSRI